ncbi:MAG: transporter [Desulfobulbaceae bacterium]|nr:transporter [Desulfobulbaceae bacterium]HIJ90310.1 transporter [Deltaproteobacteria bacterium]
MKLFSGSRIQHLCVPCVIFGLLSSVSAAFAAHPLITDDTGTMGSGKAQLELTGEYGHDKEDGVTTKTRQGDACFTYGLSEAVDLVADLPYLHARSSDATASMTENGFSDTSLAVKWRFYEDNALSLAIKPGLTLPTGDDQEGLGAGKVTYSLFFITSKEMDPWAFHLNLGYNRNENTLDEEKNIWHASIASTLAVTENLAAVANLGIESNPDKLAGTDPAFVLAGLIYALSEKLDLDCGIKYGLNDPETDYTVLAGVTWKF